MSNTILSKLAKLAVEAERRGLSEISFKTGVSMRETLAAEARKLHAAKGDQIEIESWPDFLNWWNNNRGQNLTYIFIDTYGANSEQVKMVKKLVNSAEKHERELHEFYMKLRDMASQQLDVEDPTALGEGEEGGGAGAGEVGDSAAASGMDEEAALDEIAMNLGE